MIKTTKGNHESYYFDVEIICQVIKFQIKELYLNMLAMCGGHYNDAFMKLEHRRIDEVLYLYQNWLDIHQPKDDKPPIDIESMIYEPLG